MQDQEVANEPERFLDLNQSEDWCVLDALDLAEVQKHASQFHYDPGDSIFHEGESVRGVYYVQSGLIGVRKADLEGNSTLLKIAWAGETLGYRPLIANQHHRASAEALKKSTINLIHAKTVRKLIEDRPALGLKFLKKAAKELGDAEQKFHESVTLDACTRFAHFLLVMEGRFGHKTGQGTLELQLPISRSDIAAMLGVRRESVSRAIHELEDCGFANFTDRMVSIPDPDKLKLALMK